MKKLGTYFNKMLFLCLMVVSIATFILSFFFYKRYTDVLMRNLTDVLEKNIEKSVQIMNDTYSEITQLYNSILIDSRISDFNQLQIFDPSVNYSAYQSAKKFFNTNSYIDVLYLYNESAKDSVTCGSYQFNLEDARNEIKASGTSMVFSSQLLDTDRLVLTFAFPIYADNFYELTGELFIGLDSEKLYDRIWGPDEQSAVIYNASRQPILAAPSQDNRSSIPHDQLYDWAQQSPGSLGSERKEYDHVVYLCTYYRDDVSGFTYLCGQSYSDLVAPMTRQRNLYLFVSAAVFLLAAVLQYLVAKRLYRPVAELTDGLRHSRFTPDEDMDEFALIRHVYQNTLNELIVLEKQNSVFQPRLRAELIRSLLFHTDSPEHVRRQLAENHWDIPFNGMFLCCFYIEKYNHPDVMPTVIQSQIQQAVYAHLSQYLFVECVSVPSRQVVCLINTKTELPLTFEHLLDLLRELMNTLCSSYSVTVTVGINGVINRMEDCSQIYQQTLELLNYKYVFGYNQLIYPKRVTELLPECISYPDKLESAILHSLISCNEPDFREHVDQFIIIIKQYRYQTASLLYNRLYLRALFQLQKLFTSDKSSDSGSEFLQMPRTLEDGKELLQNIYVSYQKREQAANQFKENKHYQTIMESRAFIDQHYSDCNLSAGMIAEQFGLSTNYFSKIFKTITGFYINDYIRQIRIARAQDFLVNSDMTIHAISVNTGFANPNYFYSIFKKETGMTPAAYRNAKQQQ